MRKVLSRILGRLDLALPGDTAFVERAYRELLGREADQDGLEYYLGRLKAGERRSSVLVALAASEEFLSRHGAKKGPTLPSLRLERPGRYFRARDTTTNESVWVYEVFGEEDYDWLEGRILANRYYEQEGVWTFGIDTDKRVMAEIVASFGPSRALELGCSSGAVLECLHKLGVGAEGVEISESAVARASPEVRESIRLGSLLDLPLEGGYDIAYGLDVFEHLNPNHLPRYVSRLFGLTRQGGYVFVNVPAFGHDPVFGTVFPLYLAAWSGDEAAGRPFRQIHVDDLGYPLHGHLVWAAADWWVKGFENAGLTREIGIERALHRKYDTYMSKRAPARRAYFVFSKEAEGSESRRLAERILREPSKASPALA